MNPHDGPPRDLVLADHAQVTVYDYAEVLIRRPLRTIRSLKHEAEYSEERLNCFLPN
jgi:hypothetical protein